MESITSHLQKIEECILRIEDLLEAARPVAFSTGTKVSVDRNKVYELIDELKPYLDEIAHDLPDEIVKAKRVVADAEKIKDDASSKANMILRSAESERDKMVAEHEILKRAESQADAIVEDARKFAKELRGNALEYADETLYKVEVAIQNSIAGFSKSVRAAETSLNETADLIHDNRQELRNGEKGKN
jgi:cell division septum initiation protein DivIVA